MIKIISIDRENGTFLCDDGNDYPLLEGLEEMSIQELENRINKARTFTIEFLKEFGEYV
jgi:hypothetical protein